MHTPVFSCVVIPWACTITATGYARVPFGYTAQLTGIVCVCQTNEACYPGPCTKVPVSVWQPCKVCIKAASKVVPTSVKHEDIVRMLTLHVQLVRG